MKRRFLQIQLWQIQSLVILLVLYVIAISARAETGIRTDTGQFTVKINKHKIKVAEIECQNCHLKKNRMFINSKNQPVRHHEDKNLRHGKIEVACGSCHDANISNLLRTSLEFPANFEKSSPVCMQCHVDIFRNWMTGIHGKRLGGWNLTKVQSQCIDCHDPHAVSFKKMHADPAPVRTQFYVEKIEALDNLNIAGAKPTSLPIPVENRSLKISNFPCSNCHTNFTTSKILALKLPLRPVHQDFVYKHVKDKKSCLLCHAQSNTDKLILLDGQELNMNASSELCGQCHGPVFADWQQNLHGKDIGKGTALNLRLACTSCHNPHDPKFKKLKADATPHKAKFSVEKSEEPKKNEDSEEPKEPEKLEKPLTPIVDVHLNQKDEYDGE